MWLLTALLGLVRLLYLVAVLGKHCFCLKHLMCQPLLPLLMHIAWRRPLLLRLPWWRRCQWRLQLHLLLLRRRRLHLLLLRRRLHLLLPVPTDAGLLPRWPLLESIIVAAAVAAMNGDGERRGTLLVGRRTCNAGGAGGTGACGRAGCAASTTGACCTAAQGPLAPLTACKQTMCTPLLAYSHHTRLMWCCAAG